MASEDDFSDLTDLESDDYAESKSKKKSSTANKSARKSGYKIKNALKVPRATTYTAQALYGKQLWHFFFFPEIFSLSFTSTL